MFVIELNRIYIHLINMINFFRMLVCLLLQGVDGSIASVSLDLSEVVSLSALCTLLTIGHTSSGWVALTTISAALVHRDFGICLWCFSHIVSVPLLLFYFVKIFCFI